MLDENQRETAIRLLSKFIKESSGLEGVYSFWLYIKKEANSVSWSDNVYWPYLEGLVEETLERLKKERETWHLPVGDFDEIDEAFEEDK